jgi:phenylacetate 2-hydroxylase
MPSPIVISAGLLFVYVLFKYLNRTDQPQIKGLPEVRGWPLFGSLIELGEYHAKVAQDWSKKYGPVFQVRLGNRVC